jgi:hypothetical protein
MKMHTPKSLIVKIALLGLMLGGTSFAHSSRAPRLRDLDGDGIPNISDADIDNDGILNGDDPNVDGGIALSGPYAGRYIGDKYNNNSSRETDIDSDGLADNSNLELDIDGDGLLDTDPAELDIDGDGLLDSDPLELDTDGDGLVNTRDLDDDGDGIRDSEGLDDDGDGIPDLEDPSHVGAVMPLAKGPIGDGFAPASLAGQTYITQKNGKAEFHRLVFTSDTTGTISEGRHSKPFTFSYAINTESTAVITINTGRNESSMLTIDFAVGTYSEQEFEHGRLEKAKTGGISLAVNP